MAGWVFADLLLVLFLVGLGSATPAMPEPERKAEVIKPKPRPEPKPPIVGMQTDPVSSTIRYDATAGTSGGPRGRQGRALCAKIRKASKPLKGERAALVLIFGGATDVAQGQDSARAVARQLHCAAPSVFQVGTPARPFWDGGLRLGEARLEVFLFTTKAANKSRS